MFLTYTPDSDWLKDDSRIFPVVLDPSIVVNSAIQDAYTYSAQEYSNTYLGYEQQLKVGKSAWQSDCDYFDTYLKFTGLPAIPAEQYTVDSALLMLTPKEYTGTWEEMTVGAFEITEDWKTHINGTASQRITYNNRPETLENPAATAHFNRNFTGSSAEGFEISNLVEQWYQNPMANYGVRLSMTSESTNPWDSLTFHSSRSEYAPFLTITYTEYIPVTGIEITNRPTDDRMSYGFYNLEHRVSAVVYPENATNQEVVWESSNPAVASISTVGSIYPSNSGTTVITARSAENEAVFDSFELTVYTVPVDRIRIMGRPENDELPESETVNLGAMVYPEDVTGGMNFWIHMVRWTSSNPSVATVEDGRVTALHHGTTTITAWIDFYQVSASFELTVTYVPVTNIYLANSSGEETLIENRSWIVVPVVRPEEATNQKLIATSDKPEIATVVEAEYGFNITAQSPGTAVITLSSESDPSVTKTVKINVISGEVKLNKPAFNRINVGASWQLATDPNIRISAGNSDIVTVGENGWITANKPGKVIIEAWVQSDRGGFIRYELTVTTKVSIAGRPEEDSLYAGDVYMFLGVQSDEPINGMEVEWFSDNPDVAAVTNDLVRGLRLFAYKPGTATIYAFIDEISAQASFTLTVKERVIDNIFINPGANLQDDDTLYLGEIGYVGAEIYPREAIGLPIDWGSSLPGIATVEKSNPLHAKITPKSAGSTIINVSAKGKIFDVYEVFVKVPHISITNLPANNRLNVGQVHTLSKTVDPANAIVTWTSGNQSVATVSSAGKITAKASGTTVISAKIKVGSHTVTSSFTLKVEQPVAGISITSRPANNVMNVGQTFQLKATVTPGNATNPSVTWRSSNQNVASVSTSGVVTAKSLGSTTITATAGGKSASFVLRIIKFSATISGTPALASRLASIERANEEYNVWPAAPISFCYGHDDSRYEYLRNLRTTTLLTVGVGQFPFPDAGAALNHFLQGKGAPYTIDFKKMNNEWDLATNNRINDINEALEAAELLAKDNQSVTFYSVSENQHNVAAGNNWGYTVGKYSTSIECTVQKTSDTSYSATIHYHLYDFYDFDRTQTSMGKLPVAPYEMWELHHGGFAKFYEITGTNTLIVTWTKGARYTTGASVQDIS